MASFEMSRTVRLSGLSNARLAQGHFGTTVSPATCDVLLLLKITGVAAIARLFVRISNQGSHLAICNHP